MTNPLEEVLQAKTRKRMYAVYAIVGTVLGATQVGFGAASFDQPGWLGVTLAVYSFIGAPLGLTAYSNVKV